MTRSAGRSVSGRSAASSARSMPYFAISSAALAVRACASAGVTPASSALASSLRTRASSGSAAWEFTQCLRPGRMCDRTLPAGDDSFRHRRHVPHLTGSGRPAGPSRAAFRPAPVTRREPRWPAIHPRRHPRGARAAVYTRPYGRPDGAEHPVRRLRPARQRGRGGLRGGRLAACGRHGQPFRAQPHHRPAGGGVAAQAHRPAAGLPPDDHRSGPLGARPTPRPGRATSPSTRRPPASRSGCCG